MDVLHVTFIDELYTMEPGQSLTFGREGDIVVDESNPFMHRQVGRFVHHNNVWWLSNEGRRLELTAVVGQGTVAVLPPGESLALSANRGVVRFDAGTASYELEYSLPVAVTLPESPEAEPDELARLTEDFGVIPLNDEQRQLLVALCENRLRDPAADRADLPTNAEIANRLGWSIKKFDRKLDYLCARLSDQGVKGLRGGKGLEATARRIALADHSLRSALISTTDLVVLDDLDRQPPT